MHERPTICLEFSSLAMISCGSTRPFAHGKEGLHPWGVCVLGVTFIPTVDTSKRYIKDGYIKENKRITHDIPRTKS